MLVSDAGVIVAAPRRRAARRRHRRRRCAAGRSDGLVPHARDGRWTPAAVAQARIVARLRERGHSLDEIRRGHARAGAWPSASSRSCCRRTRRSHTLEEAAAETGLEPALIERLFISMGFNADALERISDEDLELLRYVAAVLARRLPARRAAAARARLRAGARADGRRRGPALPPLRARAADARRRPGLEMAEEMEELARAAAAARLADHGPRAPALPRALRRAGRRRAHGGRPRRARRSTSAACAWRSPSPTSPATRA